MSNRWNIGTAHNLPGGFRVSVLKARKSEPVNYYGEVSRRGAYVYSFGSKLPFKRLVVIEAVYRYWRKYGNRKRML